MHTARERENFVFAIYRIFHFAFQEVLSKIGPKTQTVSSLKYITERTLYRKNPACTEIPNWISQSKVISKKSNWS